MDLPHLCTGAGKNRGNKGTLTLDAEGCCSVRRAHDRIESRNPITLLLTQHMVYAKKSLTIS